MALFFRADDLGWDHARFERLAGLFQRRGVKLNAAAIPVVCRQTRLGLERFAGSLEVHSHGFAHLDHESAGKKSEFGDGRRDGDVRRDLLRSRELMERAFGPLYFPAFVPPWNRMTDRFVPLLAEAGYQVLSRDGAGRAAVPGLREVNVAFDLHTGRGPAAASPEALLERVLALEGERRDAGVMLHHARMAETDFAFLDRFLELAAAAGLRAAFLSEWARA